MSTDYANFEWRRSFMGYDPWRDASGYAFYPKPARQYCEYFENNIRLARGDGFMGHRMELMEYQALLVGWLFGWRRIADGKRRYDTVFLYIPKKNGKSAFTSALAAVLFIADGHSDKKIYCAANVKEQAGLVFNDAVEMVKSTGVSAEHLRGTGDLSRKKVYFTPTRSVLTAISRDAHTNEGVEPSAAIVDELHTQPDGTLIDVLRKGMLTRDQPLMIYLTTAAPQGDNVCNDELALARLVRDGGLAMPNYLPMIFELDKTDDWRAEGSWRKVNPGLGKTIKIERFRQEFKLAENNPKQELEFKRLNLNWQAPAADSWLDINDWNMCPNDVTLEMLAGKRCSMALDLSATRDITALSLYFPEYTALLMYFFVPSETAAQRDEYLIWKNQGLIEIAGGGAIDTAAVRRKIQELIGGYDETAGRRIDGLYQCRAIAYDPWRMNELANTLREIDEHNMIAFRQGFVSMAEPTAKFEALVVEHQLRHGFNPVLNWMASNAKADIDPRGNTRVVKEQKDSKRKIDGIIAGIMAVGVTLRPEVAPLFADDYGYYVV